MIDWRGVERETVDATDPGNLVATLAPMPFSTDALQWLCSDYPDAFMCIADAVHRTFWQMEDAGQSGWRVTIPITRTQPNYGGERLWFRCPLQRDGVLCNQRVLILYLVNGTPGCRRCHEMTYLSAQTAHRNERLAAMLGCRVDILNELTKQGW